MQRKVNRLILFGKDFPVAVASELQFPRQDGRRAHHRSGTLNMMRLIVAAAASLSLTGCIAFQKPGNEYDLGGPQGYMAERADMPSVGNGTEASVRAENAGRCTVPLSQGAPPPS